MNAWNKEPNEVDFEHSGLKCAMRRGPHGGWCGYVAIPDSHSLHGKDYSTTVHAPRA